MVTRLQTNRIIICVIVNILLLIILYNIPTENNHILENICIYKLITGNECFNCGMTRAFLSILHCDFNKAISYNANSIIIFPLTLFIYIYSWYKFVRKKDDKMAEFKTR